MHEEEPKKFYVIEFLKGVQEIVRDVHREIENHQHHGPDDFRPEEYGAEVVINKIMSRRLPTNSGTSGQYFLDSENNQNACNWAAKEYFKLLLIDLYRCPNLYPPPHRELFINHGKCTPEPES